MLILAVTMIEGSGGGWQKCGVLLEIVQMQFVDYTRRARH